MNGNIHDRVAPRMKVFEPAEMTIGDRCHRVHIINVSLSGALLHGDRPPQVGRPITLRCGALRADARVAWVAGNRFGIAFTRRIEAAALSLLVAERPALAGDLAGTKVA